MSEARFPELLPIAFGNEEEDALMVGPVGGKPDEFVTATGFLGTFGSYLPRGFRTVSEGSRRHTQGGAVVYRTGAGGSNLIEFATAECSTPTELATAIQANERLLVMMGSNFVRKQAKDGSPVELRLQRRTVDGGGDTAASHDSLEARRPLWVDKFGERALRPARQTMLAHLATRSFITGAGYVEPNGLHYAQKAGSVKKLENYGYSSTVYRVSKSTDTGVRYEIRCSDKNLSPWAIESRIGSAVLLFTALQTPLLDALRSGVPEFFTRDDGSALRAFREFNEAYLEPDGTLKAGRFTHEGVDFQEWQSELIRKHLGKYVDLSDEYKAIVEDNIQYCHDFRKVLDGSETVDLLRDRSDIGAKYLCASGARL